MMKFIIPTLDDTNTNWACVVPHIGHDVCNVDSGKDAYIHCGGEVIEATPPPSPPMHFSMSFAYNEFDDDYNWAQIYEPSRVGYLGEPLGFEGRSGQVGAAPGATVDDHRAAKLSAGGVDDLVHP